MKRNIYKDGWHTASETLSFYVENGKMIKGLSYDNMVGITARYGCWKNVTWR